MGIFNRVLAVRRCEATVPVKVALFSQKKERSLRTSDSIIYMVAHVKLSLFTSVQTENKNSQTKA